MGGWKGEESQIQRGWEPHNSRSPARPPRLSRITASQPLNCCIYVTEGRIRDRLATQTEILTLSRGPFGPSPGQRPLPPRKTSDRRGARASPGARWQPACRRPDARDRLRSSPDLSGPQTMRSVTAVSRTCGEASRWRRDSACRRTQRDRRCPPAVRAACNLHPATPTRRSRRGQDCHRSGGRIKL